MASTVGSAQNISDLSSETVGYDGDIRVPVIRPLGVVPPVATVGMVVRRDGTSATLPITAALALADLDVYREQLVSLFPPSGTDYPADSLIRLQRARASEWVRRLLVLQGQHDVGVAGWQLVPFAEVAARAANDSLARRLFETRLAEVVSSPIDRSYVLSELSATFGDPTQDSARLARNLAVSERATATLFAMPVAEYAASYRTQHDSVGVLYQKIRTEDSLMATYTAIDAPTQVLPHGERIRALLPAVHPKERGWMFSTLYRSMATAYFVQTGDRPGEPGWARQRMAALSARVLTLAKSIPPGALTAISPEERTRRMDQWVGMIRNNITNINASFDFIGTPAPSIIAHAWFNTVDSVYRSVPTTRTMADGIIRVLVFARLEDSDSWIVVDRIQHWFPGRVEGMLVTSTTGAAGPDLVSPSNEVDWLSAYYQGMRHLSVPIAMWAGDKVVVPAMVASGKGMVPESSPMDTSAYQHRGGTFIVVDGQGKVRMVVNVQTRAQEDKLRRRIAAMLVASAKE